MRLAQSVAELRAQGLRSGQLMRDASVSPADKGARAAALAAAKSFGDAVGATVDIARGGPFEGAVAELAKRARAHAALQHKVLELIAENPGEVLMTIMNDESPAWNRLHGELTKVMGEVDVSARAASDAADSAAARSLATAAALAALALLAAAGLAWLLRRMVARELGADPAEVRATLERVAEGDLRAELHVPAGAERSLLGGVATMSAALQRLVLQVREASQGIEQASAEVAAGNFDMSQRTERTAANLQQTASAMGELTTNLQQSASAASTANGLAQSAADVAQRGGTVVSQVVTTMDEIHHSARRIADIIGVIDGIAFQTNILALNAAVEAARAGEQGRGFAVVASEVRGLAQRSAGAAREIKALIGTSVDRVASGARLVKDAGQTMDEIVGSVNRVSEVIGRITHSTGEQSDGIGRINGSVVQLDEMTQQNAALVEQSAAAAQSLKKQADRLAATVALFQLAEARAAG
ncbi:MAG: chemotaxis protein [Burkholderiales bacterium]|nr:chemotaxis protein [Burkholderiales bacterium]